MILQIFKLYFIIFECRRKKSFVATCFGLLNYWRFRTTLLDCHQKTFDYFVGLKIHEYTQIQQMPDFSFDGFAYHRVPHAQLCYGVTMKINLRRELLDNFMQLLFLKPIVEFVY